jgi:hypothetical protein
MLPSTITFFVVEFSHQSSDNLLQKICHANEKETCIRDKSCLLCIFNNNLKASIIPRRDHSSQNEETKKAMHPRRMHQESREGGPVPIARRKEKTMHARPLHQRSQKGRPVRAARGDAQALLRRRLCQLRPRGGEVPEARCRRQHLHVLR